MKQREKKTLLISNVSTNMEPGYVGKQTIFLLFLSLEYTGETHTIALGRRNAHRVQHTQIKLSYDKVKVPDVPVFFIKGKNK